VGNKQGLVGDETEKTEEERKGSNDFFHNLQYALVGEFHSCSKRSTAVSLCLLRLYARYDTGTTRKEEDFADSQGLL